MTEQLLQALLRRANARGLVIVRESVLTEELGIDQDAFRTEVRELEGRKEIKVLSSPPFLAAKLLKWSGKRSNAAESQPSAYSAIQLSNTQQLNSSYRRTGAHWPVDAALLREILETLGETDAKSFEKAVELYSPHVIRTALDRVRRAKGIRKSRTALFRHLLPRLAREASATN